MTCNSSSWKQFFFCLHFFNMLDSFILTMNHVPIDCIDPMSHLPLTPPSFLNFLTPYILNMINIMKNDTASCVTKELCSLILDP